MTWTPPADRRGAWFQTFTGIPFWPLDPRPEEIDPVDIAHALSLQCRFAGHCTEHYSVAEHCVRLSFKVPHEDALWALLHDASEAYLVDVPKPVKHSPEMAAYRAIEAGVMRAVCVRFDLDGREPASVKAADQRLLETEGRDLLNGALWAGEFVPYPEPILPWTAAYAECAYAARLTDLYHTHYLLEGGFY